MTCDKCQADMIKAELGVMALSSGLWNLQIAVTHEWKDTKYSTCECYVCRDCGYVTLQATNPEKLK